MKRADFDRGRGIGTIRRCMRKNSTHLVTKNVSAKFYMFPEKHVSIGKVGFEPTVFIQYASFQDWYFRPLSHLPKKVKKGTI